MDDPKLICTIHLPQEAGLVAALMRTVSETHPQAALQTNEAGDKIHLFDRPPTA